MMINSRGFVQKGGLYPAGQLQCLKSPFWSESTHVPPFKHGLFSVHSEGRWLKVIADTISNIACL